MKRFALACLLFILPLAAAPVPKAKCREGLVLVLPGSGHPVRLFQPDGELVNELPLENATVARLSPDGTRVAVVVREVIDAPGRVDLQKSFKKLYVVPVTYRATDEMGEPLTTTLSELAVVWTPDSKGLYVSSFTRQEGVIVTYKADRVDLYDPATGTSVEQPNLAGHLVKDVSPDGKRLLSSRFRGKGNGSEQQLLDRATFETIDAGTAGLNVTSFLTDDTLLATRVEGDDLEHVFVDIKTKKTRPVVVPKELTDGRTKVVAVYPSPGGRRLLFAWDERVPAPANWGTATCRIARLTAADLDGGNAKTVYRPQTTSPDDIIAAAWASFEWR